MRRLPLPSTRLVALAGGVAVLGALCPLAPVLVFFWRLALFLAVFLVVEDFLLRPGPGLVAVRRETAALDHVGRGGSFDLVLTNLADRTLRVAVHDRLPAQLEGGGARATCRLAPGGSLRRRVAFVGLERGEHALLPVGVRVSNRLGLLEYQEHVDTGDRVRVAPGRPAGETAWLLARARVLEEPGAHAVRRSGADWDFESMRDYVPGDELRRIDWKASARRHRPMVRVYRSERNADVILALDSGRLMGSLAGGVRKLDLAMTPVLDLAAVALQRGERVGLLVFDSEPRILLPARAGIAQLATMIDALTSLRAGEEPTSYVRAIARLEARHRKRSFVLMFTDFTDEISAQDLYAGLAALARRHIVVFVGVGDAHLDAVFDRAREDDESELFEKAVAGQLLAERRRTLARIEHLGVATLDAEPRRLSGPLIRKFLELRLGKVL